MATMKAVKIETGSKATLQDNITIPKLRPSYILAKTKAVALNPTDWKHINGRGAPGTTVGCDWAGVVEEVGEEVTKDLKKGDRVCGFCHGANKTEPEDGSFAEYLVNKGDLILKIPDWMSFEDAATFGVGVVTCGQGMYQHMKLNYPNDPVQDKQPLLVYGGSTGTGMFAIQYGVLSGYEVYTTCSPRNNELVKSLGASHVYDYKSPTCSEDIRRDTNNKLFYAFDCISEGSSPGICCAALSSDGKSPQGAQPTYGTILGVKTLPRSDINMTYTLGYTVSGEYFEMPGPPGQPGRDFPAKQEDFAFAKEWVALSEKLIADKKLKPHRPSLRSGGLEKIFEGLDDVKNGRTSGEKVVYTVD